MEQSDDWKKKDQEVESLKARLDELTNKHLQLKEELEEKKFQLVERNKELGCIYQITQLINDPENMPGFVLAESIKTLSQSYLYSDVCCGRILLGNDEFRTDNFQKSQWRQYTEIGLKEKQDSLKIEIYYLEEKPKRDDGPFLSEEKKLLETVAMELATFLDRKMAVEETRISAETFKSVFNSLQDPVFVHDFKGNMIEVNKMACEKLNFTKEELLQKTPMDIDDPAFSKEAPLVFKIIDDQGWFRGETVHISKDGKKIPAELNSSKVQYQGKPVILTIARDITERKQYEQDLLKAKDEAEQSTRLKSAFLANLSHEIRTPLNAILGFSDLLNKQELSDEKKREFVSTIQQSGQNLLSIMDDILDLSMIESNQVEVEKKHFSLNNLVEQLVAETRSNIELTGKDIECISYKSLSDDNDLIESDYDKIQQIYQVLLDNALKFTDKGTIEVGYTVKSSDHIDFFVKDTGVGIPGESKELVFERFRQVDQSITRKYEGLGLGLSIADGLVKQLGGSISVVSQIQQGSDFTFSLPVKHSHQLETETKKEVSKADLTGKTILVAEDDKMNFLLVKEFLIDTNADIKHAENGVEAVNFCKSNKVDLVIMDIKMPLLDGIEAFNKIKDLQPDLPIIAFTAHAYENDKQRLLQKGFDQYISKPVKQDELRALVQLSI